jgi:protein phosphatase PTC7
VTNDIDSPFALLAKDNGILWSGGMPDDCTVVALRVIKSIKEDREALELQK